MSEERASQAHQPRNAIPQISAFEGEARFDWEHDENGEYSSIRKNERRILALSGDNIVKLAGGDNGKELATLRGHKDFVFSASLGADGKSD